MTSGPTRHEPPPRRSRRWRSSSRNLAAPSSPSTATARRRSPVHRSPSSPIARPAIQTNRAQLDALVGVINPPRDQPLARSSPTFAPPLLGSYGPVTADTIKNSTGRYVAGDFAGGERSAGTVRRDARRHAEVTVTARDKPDAPPFEKAPVKMAPR